MSAGHERPGPRNSAPAAKDPPSPNDGQREGEERYGPLLLVRHGKEDGRALILYSVAGSPEEPEP